MDLKETTDKVIKYKLKYSAQELEGKLDKVDQEYSLEEKEKLNGLKNYDDSQIKSDVNTLTENKLDKNQGTENSGKVLGTNANGEVIPLNGYGFEYDEETKMLKYGTDPTTNLNQGIGLDDTLSKRGYAADAGAVGELKEDLVDLQDGKDTTIITYYDELGNGIGGNIYKSNKVLIPAKTVITSIQYYSKSVGTSAILFILDSNDKIVGRYEQTSYEVGWNTFELNTSFDFDCYIAISGGSVRFSYSNAEKDKIYSNGLFECSASERNKGVNETLAFTQNVPTRYYEFSVVVQYHVNGVSDLNALVDNRLTKLETDIHLTDFKMPRFYRTSEEGYSLFGRWYKFSTFNECCNCGGQSIVFKVKKATTISVDLREIIHPSHPDWKMSVRPYFAYSIDGSDFTRVQISGESATSIEIPSTDEHLVWIVVDGMCLHSGSANRNSGWSGVYIHSITTDGKMYKVESKSRNILFVGDSIVEGINTLGTTSTSDTNSSVNEFSFRTARKLNAMPLLQGFGGSTAQTGLKFERYSYVDTSSEQFIVYNDVDMILVEYGYNDSNAGMTGEQFKQYYGELLDVLIGHYTNIPIICLVPFNQSFAQYIREVADERKYCYVVETSDYDITYSDNAHPNASGAESIAIRLSADIEKLVGKQYFMN